MNTIKHRYLEDKESFDAFYKSYISTKQDEIKLLTQFFDGIELNKNYFRTGLKNNHKFRSNKDTDTYTIKFLNNSLNKISNINKDTIISEILKECKPKTHLYEYFFDTILQKTITHSNYIECYALILQGITDESSKNILLKGIEKIQNKIQITHNIEKSSYDNLCDLNLYTEKIYGLNLLLVKLEKLGILKGYIKQNLNELFILLEHSEDENIIYRILSCLYQMKCEINDLFSDECIQKLHQFKANAKPKNKFKIMDILE